MQPLLRARILRNGGTVNRGIEGATRAPRRITVSLVRKQIEIGYLNMYMASGRLPETSAYLGRHAETWEEWRKWKVYWAVQEFKRSGTLPDVRDVMVKAGIDLKWFEPIERYALECINQFLEVIRSNQKICNKSIHIG